MKNKKLWVPILAGFMAFVMLAGLVLGSLPSEAEATSLSEL